MFKTYFPKSTTEIDLIFKQWGISEKYLADTIECICVSENKFRGQKLATIKYKLNAKTQHGTTHTENIWLKGKCEGI